METNQPPILPTGAGPRALLAALAAGCAVAVFSACNQAEPPVAAAPATPAVVQTALPHRGRITRSLSLPTFRILPIQQAVLCAKVPGYLKTLLVDKGDTVRAGQPLGEIEAPELLADEREHQTESDVARTNYLRVAAARERAPDLVVPQTVDDLRGQWQVAEARLERTRTLLGYAHLTAPFAGTVTARFVDPGAFIPAATATGSAQTSAILTLMDFSRVRIQVYVPEAEVPLLANGAAVQVSVEELGSRVFTGSITRQSGALEENTKTMLAEIELPNPGAVLRPGMYASVKIELEKKSDVLLVPVGAVLTEKAGSSVFVVAGGKVKKTPVTTGFADSVNVEITAGLEGSPTVALPGRQTLSDGQSVTVTEAK